jgi:peptidoglycan/xylan/chitin deacetylase (PgdA/CDA1 family)
MYHRFDGAQEEFARQCDHLRARYHPISLSEAFARLCDGSPLPDYSVVLTVDDGYADFFESAFPVLADRRLPATVYLVTDFLDRRLWLWVDRLEYALCHARVSTVEIPLPDRPPLRVSLALESERAAALRILKEILKELPNGARLQTLRLMPELLEVEIPPDPPEWRRPLTWDQVRIMGRSGLIEFGGHSCSHPILSRIEDPADLTREIGGCRVRIETELQQPVRHFCYPNGRAKDVGPAVVEVTRQAGYRSAVSTIPGLNYAGADLFLLRRIGVQPVVPFPWFERVTAGVGVR